MSTETRRRCRTCPAIFSGSGDADRCPACSDRSAAVRAAVSAPPAGQPAASPSPPRPRACERDGHHACEHFRAIRAVLQEFMDDCEWCQVCGAEADDDGLVHKAGCALFAIIRQETVTARPAGPSTELGARRNV